MSCCLIPRCVLSKITDLDPDSLLKNGITFLLMDFDNTIVPYSTDTPSKEFLCWLQTIQLAGISVCVVSNSRKPRVQIFCKTYGIPCITRAKKPFAKGILEAKRTFQIDFSKAALVGDQIFTDVLGANRNEILSILVKPIQFTNIWLRIRYWIEQPFIAIGRRRQTFELSQ